MVGHSFVTVSLPIMALLFGFGHSARRTESGCKYDGSDLTYVCTNITDFPKDMNGSTKVLQILDSVLNGASFESIVGLLKLKILDIRGCTLKDFAFENLNLPVNLSELKIHDSNVENIGIFQRHENLTKLDISVKRNKLTIEPGAFDKLSKLSHLTLENNQLDSFPVFRHHSKLTELSLMHNNIKQLKKDDLTYLGYLVKLDISTSRNKLTIEPGAFDKLSHLSHLILENNQLDSFPVFKRPSKLTELYLKNNNIKQLKKDDLTYLRCLEILYLMNNNIKQLREDDLTYLGSLKTLDLTDNPIKSIQSGAFKNLNSLDTLVLDGSEIETLPTNGLQNLRNLSLRNVHTLRRIPEGLNSVSLVKLAADKSFLCCMLKFRTWQDSTGPSTIVPLLNTSNNTEGCFHPTSSPSRSTTDNMTVPDGFGKKKRALPIRHITLHPSHKPNTSKQFIPIPTRTPLNCTPGPTPFQPCEDIMGADWLTAVSFIVAPFALCGNFVVIVVFLCMARNYNVSRFLVTNLAIADMSMGIYLLSLVIESVITSGEYYLHVERFQFGMSCKVLGFLAMFSSELSVFALTLITVERYMTIVYAMYPKRRLSMRTAVICMGIGWTVAITVAILPIVGVGSYGKVAICLPFDTQNGGDLYLYFIFGVNGVSFAFICALYAQIYRSVFKTNSNSTPTRGHDSRVARRMAILVFTDFACFAPIAVAGLSALLGHALINVEQSKYLLVFFFPLNGLLNPFLYAIITKTFRRDLAALLKNCFVCGGTLTNYLSNFPARSVQSTNDALSPSARPSLDFNGMEFHSMGNIRGSRENPVSASFSKSEPNLVKFIQDAELDS